MSMTASITPSTTTPPRRATTRRRPIWPASGPSASSRSTSPLDPRPALGAGGSREASSRPGFFLDKIMAADEADYVIVGAGSAGCALAYRLSEDGRYRVLVLEHG